MKVHYINILLFELPLNILIYNQRNHKNTTHHTPKISTTRLLCECELYAPANYDNDPQMKAVMENYNRQTSDRFKEYDERMKTTRQKCKDKCDKEIQKIILKDKLEKELMDKFATLDTDIQSDAIPSCVCEKSIADKMEKGCLRCGYGLGSVAPMIGLTGAVAVNAWKTAELAAAKAAAIAEGAAKGAIAGNAQGMEVVINFLKYWGVDVLIPKIYETFVATNRYADVTTIAGAIAEKHAQNCAILANGSSANGPMCETFGVKFGLMHAVTHSPIGGPANIEIPQKINELAEEATEAADAAAKAAEKSATAAAIKTSTEAIETTSYNWYTTIGYSITAILIIVLIMVIIYKILRYRRKKKMKKKLQYIKLLEE
ncbi:rifin [Plasmodium falciparum IGH-CR14]|uniref:Rifin n=1 Tax=Plasmodium falciparum IGH-CR14 TaxID=580059 RepID=A0A0L1I4S2_PLAFA|nr:rifin [Plasmodium falciparum IGH-CR14]